MGELVFYTGTMDSGKSTLALQTDYNHASRGRRGLILSSRDRTGSGRLSSRLGLSVPALEVDESLDLWSMVTELLQGGEALQYVIADEVQFYTEAQVEDLARIADDLGLDVFAFGITTDFRTRLFPGSRRLLELADRVAPLQVEALCWCGARAIHNARTLGGRMVTEGEQVMVGDVDAGASLGYEVLCRSHYRRGETAASARAPLGDDTLFG